MAEPKKKMADIKTLAEVLDKILREDIYGRQMGYLLVVWDLDTGDTEACFTNGERSRMIKSLRDFATILESNVDFPETIGTA